MGRGRPTYLTSELITVIVDLLKRGATVESLCGIIGIDDSTFYEWQAKGKEQEDTIFVDLVEAIRAARGRWELKHIENIKDDKWILTHHPLTKERWKETRHEEREVHFRNGNGDIKRELEKNLRLLDEPDELQGEPQEPA